MVSRLAISTRVYCSVDVGPSLRKASFGSLSSLLRRLGDRACACVTSPAGELIYMSCAYAAHAEEGRGVASACFSLKAARVTLCVECS